MTPEERAENNISLNREWNTDEQIRKQITAEIRKAVEEAVKNDSTMSLFIHKRLLREAVEEAQGELADAIKGGFDEGLITGKALAYEEVLKSDSYRMNIWKAAQVSAYEDAAEMLEDHASDVDFVANSREDVADYLDCCEKKVIAACEANAKRIRALKEIGDGEMNDEINKAAEDALRGGTGFMLDGKRIDPSDVLKSREDYIIDAAEALAKAATSWAFCPQQSIIARDKQLQSLKNALAAYEKVRGRK